MQLILNPSEQSQWYALVGEAQSVGQIRLETALECYLVSLLQRFSRKPGIIDSVLGLELLESAELSGVLQHEHLRELGDKCLLFSGLFPHNAKRRQVDVRYFVEIGQSAYTTLSCARGYSLSELFELLSHDFVEVMTVLQSVRFLSRTKNTFVLSMDNISNEPDVASIIRQIDRRDE